MLGIHWTQLRLSTQEAIFKLDVQNELVLQTGLTKPALRAGTTELASQYYEPSIVASRRRAIKVEDKMKSIIFRIKIVARLSGWQMAFLLMPLMSSV